MYYLGAFQILCGGCSAFVAARKGRNPIFWWLVGTLVPIFGVVLSLAVAPADHARVSSRPRQGSGEPVREKRRIPKRCCGSYIPDCLGCPFFRRQLFATGRREGTKGFCEHLQKELRSEPKRRGSRVTIEDR